MTTNTNLVHAIADALVETHGHHGQDATEWFECGGRAKVGRGVAGWRAAIGDGAWTDRSEDILVLRALRHVEHTVELADDARIEPPSARSSTRTGPDGGAAGRRGLGRSACQMFNAAPQPLGVCWQCAGASFDRCSCRNS